MTNCRSVFLRSSSSLKNIANIRTQMEFEKSWVFNNVGSLKLRYCNVWDIYCSKVCYLADIMDKGPDFIYSLAFMLAWVKVAEKGGEKSAGAVGESNKCINPHGSTSEEDHVFEFSPKVRLACEIYMWHRGFGNWEHVGAWCKSNTSYTLSYSFSNLSSTYFGWHSSSYQVAHTNPSCQSLAAV